RERHSCRRDGHADGRCGAHHGRRQRPRRGERWATTSRWAWARGNGRTRPGFRWGLVSRAPARRWLPGACGAPHSRRGNSARKRASVIKVGLVDDQAMVRVGLRMILEAEPDIEIVGEAEDGADALALVRDYAPDV